MSRLERFRTLKMLGATFTEPCLEALFTSQVGVRNWLDPRAKAAIERARSTPIIDRTPKEAARQ